LPIIRVRNLVKEFRLPRRQVRDAVALA